MEVFKVHVLGCGSATPTLRHNCSTQVVEIRGKLFMVDCAEGTQKEMLRTHLGYGRLHTVLLSHLHGDHCFGLMGMICTMGMTGRTAPLHVYAPPMLENILNQQLEMFAAGLEFQVVFHPVDTTRSYVIYEDRSLTITTIPLNHRVPCCGFLFTEKPTLPHIRRDMIDFLGIPYSEINNIKNGADWITDEGETIPNSRLVTPADPVRSYAYCSDTKYLPHLHELVKGVNLLYHESTYTDEKVGNAAKYHHSTGTQAATVAKDAGVKKLLLGHFSASTNESLLLEQARQVFPDTFLASEGMTVSVE